MAEGEKKKSLFPSGKLFQKMKSIKHIEFILVGVFVAILLLIYFSSTGSASSSTTENKSEILYSSVGEYVKSLEDKLKDVLSQVKGAGKISVMVAVDGGIEYVYAERIEEKTNTNTSGSYTTTSTTVTTTPDRNIIVKQIMPPVSGVLVIASGASDLNVKLRILTAVQSVITVKASSIEVVSGI